MISIQTGSILNFEFERQLVTFATADMRLGYAAAGLLAEGMDLDPFLKQGRDRPFHCRVEL